MTIGSDGGARDVMVPEKPRLKEGDLVTLRPGHKRRCNCGFHDLEPGTVCKVMSVSIEEYISSKGDIYLSDEDGLHFLGSFSSKSLELK